MRAALLCLILSFGTIGCAYRGGATYAGGQVTSRWNHATLGTDIENEEISAEGAKIGSQNQSKVATVVTRTAGTYGAAALLAGVTETNSNNATAEVLGGQKTDAAKAAGQQATNQLKLTEQTKQKALELVPKP